MHAQQDAVQPQQANTIPAGNTTVGGDLAAPAIPNLNRGIGIDGDNNGGTSF